MTISRLSRGTYRIEAHRAGRVRACTEVTIGRGSGDRGSGRWDLESQALYAAWIEHLFDAPPGQSLSFPSLEPVLRDPGRNFLYDYQWVPPRTGQSGLLLAVDAQPDNSVSRKRFWEGTFLFAPTPSAGPGFKADRPLVTAGVRGRLRPLPNSALDGANAARSSHLRDHWSPGGLFDPIKGYAPADCKARRAKPRGAGES